MEERNIMVVQKLMLEKSTKGTHKYVAGDDPIATTAIYLLKGCPVFKTGAGAPPEITLTVEVTTGEDSRDGFAVADMERRAALKAAEAAEADEILTQTLHDGGEF